MSLSARIALISTVIFIGSLSWLVSQLLDCRDFQARVSEQSSAVDAIVRIQETFIHETVSAVDSETTAKTETVDTLYRQYLDDLIRVHNSAARDSQQVSTAARASDSAESAPPGQSHATDKGLAQKLLKCESRLLYEAKEYDILATHYNALLKIYEYSKEQNKKADNH